MKQLIILCAIIPIMLVFVMQFSLDQINQSRINQLQELVYASKEEARQTGYFSNGNKNKLINNIAECFDIAEEDVIFECTEEIKYRDLGYDETDLIEYSVSVPIEKIMAGNKLMGISDEENSANYIIRGRIASERLPEG